MDAVTEYAAKIDSLAKALLDNTDMMIAASAAYDAAVQKKDTLRYYEMECHAVLKDAYEQGKSGPINGSNKETRDVQAKFLTEQQQNDPATIIGAAWAEHVAAAKEASDLEIEAQNHRDVFNARRSIIRACGDILRAMGD